MMPFSEGLLCCGQRQRVRAHEQQQPPKQSPSWDWSTTTLATAGKAKRHLLTTAQPSILDLGDGLYLKMASFSSPSMLHCLDTTCCAIRDLNCGNHGQWRALGLTEFFGFELVGHGTSGVFDPSCRPSRLMQTNWKKRISRFRLELPIFRAPFCGSKISSVTLADEIAYCNCRLLSEALASSAAQGAFVEILVKENPDNVSMSVVDFEAGGCSSLTFSPDTGAVIRERKVRETPRRVEGAYLRPLEAVTDGKGFEGSVGLYMCGGQLAFFRRYCQRLPPDATGARPLAWCPWETTGFISDLSWSSGSRLTPCVAFRNAGPYEVELTGLGPTPPVVPVHKPEAFKADAWTRLDWDALEQEEAEDDEDDEDEDSLDESIVEVE